MSLVQRRTTYCGFAVLNFDFPRWGGEENKNWDVLDAILGEGLGLPTTTGPWQNNKSYVIGARAVDTDLGKTFICLVAHTSAPVGTFEQDRLTHPSYWRVYTSVPIFRGAYTTATTTWFNGDIFVVDLYRYYLVIKDKTTTGPFVADPTSFTLVIDVTALDKKYLGAKNADPTVDNQGAPLTVGALYFNTPSNLMKTWNGTQWVIVSTIGATPFGMDFVLSNNAAEALHKLGLDNNTAIGRIPVYSDTTGGQTESDLILSGGVLAATINDFVMDGGAAVKRIRAYGQFEVDIIDGVGKVLTIANNGSVSFLAEPTRTSLQNYVVRDTQNKIINGDFSLNQRNIAALTTSGYGPDRWFAVSSSTSHNLQTPAFALGQTDVAGSPLYYARLATTSVAAAGAFCIVRQPIEFVRAHQGLHTVTFWARSDNSSPISVEIEQYFGAGGSGSTFLLAGKVNTTTSWQKFSLSFTPPSVAGKTLGTGANSMNVNFWFDAGSDYNARTGTLGQRSDVFNIAHVSVLPGDWTTHPDPFFPRQLGEELLLCRRYYVRLQHSVRFITPNASGIFAMGIILPTIMRTIPVVSLVTAGSRSNINNLVVNPSTTPGNIYYQLQNNAANTDSFSFEDLIACDSEM